MKNDDYFMLEAFKEAEKAFNKNEIPVGAVIVENNKIIARAHNNRDSYSIVTAHAEILAVEKANKKKRNWRLLECTIYSTLKPCEMCMEVLKTTKIKRIVYAANQKKNIEENVVEVEQIENFALITNSEKIIKQAFLDIRKKNDVSRETFK